MNSLLNHGAYNAARTGQTIAVSMRKIVHADDLTPQAKKLLRIAITFGELHWIDSWAHGRIKTSNMEQALQLLNNNTVALIDAICGWQLHWNIEYTFYCRTQSGEFYENSYTYTEKNVSINQLQDTINECVRAPAKDLQNHNHIYDEGWKATILPY